MIHRGPCRCATLLAAVLCAGAGGHGEPPAAITSQEQALWQSVVTLRDSQPTTQPFDRWFEAARRQRQALLDRTRLYLTLYPGGTHRDEAIRTELTALFELATLGDGTLAALCERVAVLLRNPPSPAAEQEAAYWQIVCERAESRPTSQPGDMGEDPALLAAYRRYVDRYPDSPYVPRLATLLFEDAARRADRPTMLAMVELLGTRFADDAGTEGVRAAWRRIEAIGHPFWLQGQTADGEELDSRRYLGAPVIVVVWAGYDLAACQRAVAIELFRQTRPTVHVIGVSLDETAEAARAAARRLRLTWPQYFDGLGWGTTFVRTWGVREMPFVFVIDAEGRLVGATAGEEWRRWAAAVTQASGGPATQPGTGTIDSREAGE